MKREDITHLGNLARIELSSSETDALASDITEILDYVSQIDEITGSEKAKSVGAHYNIMREDEPSHEPGAFTEALLASAPRRKGNYIEVKKILGGE